MIIKALEMWLSRIEINPATYFEERITKFDML